jgi:hypothetical protein
LCEAAQTAKRSPQFATTYQAIARRRGKKIATTAVAGKLLTRAYHLLTEAENAENAARRSHHRDVEDPHTPAVPRPAPRPGGSPHARVSSQNRMSRPSRRSMT